MDSAGQKPTQMVALGRPFNLGMLYDFRSDKLIPGITLWDKEKLDKDMSVIPKPNTEFSIVASESISDKSYSLGVEASLKASFLFGLVEVEGSAKYLNNTKKSSKQARVTLQYKTTTEFKQLNMDQLGTGNLEHSDVIDKDLATHVVTGILYGAQAFFVFDQETSDEDNVQDIQGSLSVMVKKIPTISIEGSGSLKLAETDKDKVNKFSCTFHGDFLLEKSPTTFEEAVKVYQDLPKLLGPNAEKAVPVTVYLLPLSILDSRASKLFRQISVRLVTEAENILEGFAELEMWCNDVLNSPAGQNFSQISKKVKTFKALCSEFKLELQGTLAKKLPSIRGGGEEEAALAEVLKKAAESPFKIYKLKQWMEDKDEEVNTIKMLMKLLKNTEFVSSKNALINKVSDSEKALVFVLTSLDSTEPFLSELEKHLKQPQSDRSDAPEPGRWYSSKDVNDSARRKAKLFGNFAKANKDRDKESIQFLAIGLADENHEGATISLYEDGSRVSEDLELPSKPKPVTVGEVTHNTVSLTFSVPPHGAQSVTGYRVEFSKTGLEDWKHQEQAEAGEVTLTGLIPNTEYSVRVRAVTDLGFGSAAAAQTPIRTLEVCGPPEDLTGTATATELSVRWKKPVKVGQGVSIERYIVEYGQTQEKIEWNKELSESEEKVISGLQPKTSYSVRVLCDCGENGTSLVSSTITVTTAAKEFDEAETQLLLQQIQAVLKFGYSMDERSEFLCLALAYILQESETVLEDLDQSQYQVPVEGKKKLLRAVRNCRKAWFANCGLSVLHCEVVASALSSTPSHLRDLDLSENNLGDSGVAALCAALKTPQCELSSLRLYRCGITEMGCSSLASALKSNPSRLTKLDLGENGLSDSGVSRLCGFLESPDCRLQTLRLERCGLTQISCSCLASALKSNPSYLTELELRFNAVGDAGVAHLCGYLQMPDCSLETLGLQQCGLSTTSSSSLASALKSNPSTKLATLDVGNNSLFDAEARELLELSRNPECRLKSLSWAGVPS